MHKIRETIDDEAHEWFVGQVEADETYIGVKERDINKGVSISLVPFFVGK